MVSADGTVVNNDVPCPKSDRIPLLDLEFLLSLDTLAAGALALLSDGRIAHLNVGHVSYGAGQPARPRYG